MTAWTSFFSAELGAAAALAGLLFVSVSTNQARILELGRIADRGLEALVMLLLVIAVATAALVPGQPLRLLGAEILAAGSAAFATILSLQRVYLAAIEEAHRPRSRRMALPDLATVAVLATSGLVMLWRGDQVGLYFVPAGVLLSFFGAGANAWVLLIEINR
jgi:cation transport ATPase